MEPITIEERIDDLAGFVYIGETKRVVWQKITADDPYIEVSNHSNWGAVSGADQQRACDALAGKYGLIVRPVQSLTRT